MIDKWIGIVVDLGGIFLFFVWMVIVKFWFFLVFNIWVIVIKFVINKNYIENIGKINFIGNEENVVFFFKFEKNLKV